MIHRRRHAALTLLELLMVIAIVGILVGVMLPSMKPAVYDQLRSTAQIVATDLAYARSLAIANNSKYTVTFNVNANQYTLKHTTDGSSLDNLPASPFSSSSDTLKEHHVALAELPHVGPTVRLAAVATVNSSGAIINNIDNVEFDRLGQTTRTDITKIWLTAGVGGDQRYIAMIVNPVTGMTTIEEYTEEKP